jgi:RimJ/RimL family protein N-acetyltransferase
MGGSDFARLRSVGTGSWVTRSEQGRGYGTEARLAVLELAFGHLGAEEARDSGSYSRLGMFVSSRRN